MKWRALNLTFGRPNAFGVVFLFEMIDPVITLAEAEKWDKPWSDHFLKGQEVLRHTDQEIPMISKRHSTPATRKSR